MRKTLFAIVVFLVAATAPYCSGEETYRLHLPRTYHVGDVHSVVHGQRFVATREFFDADGKHVRTESDKSQSRLAGLEKVVELDEHETVGKSLFIVTLGKKTAGDEVTEFFKPGTVLELLKSHKKREGKRVLIDGEDATREAAEKVGVTFAPLGDASPGADLMILGGPDKPRAIGDRWDVPGDLLAKHFSSASYSLIPGSTTGHIELAGIERVNGMDCLKLKLQVTSIDVEAKLPSPAISLENCKMQLDTEVLLPVRKELPLQRLTNRVRMSVDIRATDGEARGTVVKSSSDVTITFAIDGTDQPLRRWQDSTGKYTTQAKLVHRVQDNVTLLKENGTYAVLPVARLSATDLNFLRDVGK